MPPSVTSEEGTVDTNSSVEEEKKKEKNELKYKSSYAQFNRWGKC